MLMENLLKRVFGPATCRCISAHKVRRATLNLGNMVVACASLFWGSLDTSAGCSHNPEYAQSLSVH